MAREHARVHTQTRRAISSCPSPPPYVPYGRRRRRC